MFKPLPLERGSQGTGSSLDLGIQFPRFNGTTHRFKRGDEIIGRSNLYRSFAFAQFKHLGSVADRNADFARLRYPPPGPQPFGDIHGSAQISLRISDRAGLEHDKGLA